MTLSEKPTKNSFLSGVALLTASAAAVKLIGVFYKIPLVALIGIEGMAYFLAAYHIYTLLFMISTAGLPVAVSILVSKRLALCDESGAQRIFSVSLKLFLVIGAAFCAGMYLFADTVAASIQIPEAALSIKAISPALFFASAASAVRGYFQGRGIMHPTAISQVIESVGKLAFGLLFCKLGINLSLPLPVISALAIAGISVGSALSCFYLAAVKLKSSKGAKKCCGEMGAIIGDILKISAPITIGAAVMSLTGLVDTALVSSRLQAAGFSPADANSMYSSYGNLAIPLFNLVPSFISPIAVTVAPMLAAAAARGEHERERRLLFSALRLCALFSVPACFGLALFSEPILSLLYPTQPGAVRLAAPMLSVLSPAVFFSCMITVTNSVLQAYGKEKLPIISTLFGVTVKTLIEFFLLASVDINIFGAPISTLFCDLLMVCINLLWMQKYTCGTGGMISFCKLPLFASLPAGISSAFLFALLCRHGLDGRAALMAVVVAFVAVYLVFAAWNGALCEKDLIFLPKGEKIIKIMKKIRLLRNDNEQRRKNKIAQKQGKI